MTTFEVKRVDSVAVVVVHGNLVEAIADELRNIVVAELENGASDAVLLNLADMRYVDSMGLGEIVRCQNTANRRGGRFGLCCLRKKIQDLLAITKLFTLFKLYDTEEEGVRDLL